MNDSLPLEHLIHRVRDGQEDAAEELWRTYAPHVRRVIRVRMTDPALHRRLDSEDICQSVMADFFVRVALGQYDVESSEQLLALLGKMARNRLLYHVEKHKAARRDVHRESEVTNDRLECATSTGTPSQSLISRELFDKARKQLTAEEIHLVEQRKLGRSWVEIAEELGCTADSARRRLDRATERVAKELGFVESDDGRTD